MKDNKGNPTKKSMALNAAALLTAVLMLFGSVGVMLFSANIVEAEEADGNSQTSETFPWDMLETDSSITDDTDDFYDNDVVSEFYETLPHKWDETTDSTVTTTKATEVSVDSISLDRTYTTVNVGENFSLYVTYYPYDAVPPTIVWQSSNSTVASVDINGYVTVKNSGTARITATTGNGKTAYCDVTVKNPVKSLKFAEKEITIGVGDFTPLKCTVDPSDADDRTLTWTSSDPSAVSVDANGTVKGIKGGSSATITATAANGVSASIVVKVAAAKPESVSLNATEKTLYIGDTFTLKADIKPSEAANDKLTWMSGNSAVATVSDGVVMAVGTGTTTITVETYNGKTDSCVVTVKVKEAESVKLNKDSLEMAVGDTETLTATVKPDDAADKTVTWSSSNNSIVTVKDGKLTANKKGTATITVKTTNGKSATCKVTVKDTEPTGVTITPSTVDVKIGDLLTLSAKVTPDKADQTVTWTSSNTSIATVSRNGVIKGITVGTVTITAKTANGKTATCKVTVKPVEVSSISLDKTSASAKAGETVSLSVTYNPSNATNKSVSWTSSNSSVATVSNGVVTARNVGTTTITAKTSNGKTATCQVTVTPIEVDSISLNVTAKELEQGKTLALYATVSPENASVKTVTWTSSNPSIVTVNTNGSVTAKSAGTATITATSNNGKTATCKITVPEVSVTNITLSKTSASLDIGESVALTTTITPSNAGNKSVTWAVDDSSVATVDSNGNVKAVGEGKTIVTAKTANGKTAACTITVVDLSNFKFEFLPNKQRVELGVKTKLAFTPVPEGVSVTFEATDTSEITIDKNGYVIGNKMGLTTVSAKVNGIESVCYVTVGSNRAIREAARKQFAEEILYYVNIERKKEGLAPVQLMDDLSYLAQIRTDEQVKVYDANRDLYRTEPFISHTRPDGTPWSTVFEYASIPNVKARAENLIQGAGYTAEGCVKKWMNSPGHRANILKPNITHMGIGVEFVNIKPEGGSTSLCVTQLFIQQGRSK